MKTFSTATCIFAITTFAVLLPQFSYAAPAEPFKWYGLGGELTGESNEPRRWLGRLGISEDLGLEGIFAMQHRSRECGAASEGDCDLSRLDFGAGVIYDVAPSAAITPYFAGRLIVTWTGEDGHHDDTSATAETACGAEYVIMKRLGISGELNFRFHTDPTEIVTSTRVRAYFYF